MKSAFGALAAILLLGGCQTGGTQEYSLGAGEKGVFNSRNAGAPIPADRIKGLDEAQLVALLGAPQLSDIMAVESATRFRRPMYAGNAIVTVEVAATDLKAQVFAKATACLRGRRHQHGGVEEVVDGPRAIWVWVWV